MNTVFSMPTRRFKISIIFSLVLSMLIVLSPLSAPQARADTGPISITSFTIENPVFDTGSRFVLAAELDRKPESSEQLSIFFIEDETGKVVGQCRSQLDCESRLSFQNGGPRNYYAVVGSHEDPAYPDNISQIPTIVAYSSNMVTAQRAPWEVSLRTDKEEFSAGQYFTLTATFNQSLSPLETQYIVYIVEKTSGNRVGTCVHAGSKITPDGNYECSMTRDFKNGNPRTYQAIVALNPPTIGYPDTIQEIILEHDPQAISNEVTVSRAPWTVEQFEDSTATFVTNQNLSSTGSSYALYVVDDLSGRILHSCSSGDWCITPARHGEYYDKPLTAYIAAYDLRAGSLEDLTEIQASSSGYSLRGIDRGLPSPEENTGGFNPSQLCGHTCVADPVNAITGEYYENHSDMHLKGVGAGEIDFARSYGVFQRNRDGALGYGWTHSYEMRLVPGEGYESLDEAKEIKLLQENGSLITFYRNNQNELITQARNIANLDESNDSGDKTYRFSRRNELKNYVFDSSGKLISIEDTNGNQTSLEYDADNQLVSITSNKGTSVHLSYNPSGRVVLLTDHAGRHVEYEYSPAGDLTRVVNAAGQVYSYTYDNNHAILTFTNPLGGTTTNSYSSNYTIRRQTEPDGSQWSFSFTTTYSSFNTVTDPMGNRTRYYHDKGRLVRQVDAYGTPDEASTWYTYSANNAISSIQDPMGHTRTFLHDENGNLLLETSPEGRTIAYTYNEHGQVLSRESGGIFQQWEYDNKGNLTKETSPSGYVTEYTYNPDGTLASAIDPRGNEPGSHPGDYMVQYEYDTHGHLTSILYPSGARERFDKDELGRTVVIYDPRWINDTSKAHFIEYNNLGEISKVLNSNEEVKESYSYDPMGNLLSQSDAKGNAEHFEYDVLGRNTSIQTRRGFVTEFMLNKNGQVSTVQLPNGAETTTTYDRRGNIISSTDAEGNTTEYRYDLNNRLVQEILPGGTTSVYEYSPDGLLVKRIAGDGGEVTYSYDALGQLSVTTDEVGRTVTYGYTPEGLVESLEFLGGSQITNEYDASGNLVSRTNEEGQIEQWEYDNDGNKTSYTNIGGQRTEYSYDEAGNLVSSVKPDGTIVDVQWDEESLISQISYGSPADVLTYEYDENGMVVKESNGDFITLFAYDEDYNIISESQGSETTSYSYDSLGSLTSLGYPSGVVVNYLADKNGNLRSIESENLPGAITMTRTSWGDISNTSYPNGASMKQEFDNAQRLIDMRLEGPDNELLWEEAYERDLDGVIAARSGTITSDEMGYNDRGWLTSNNENGIQYTLSGKLTQLDTGLNLSLNALGAPTFVHDGEDAKTDYSYNALGQRISQSDIDSGDSVSYSWNRLEQLTGISSSSGDIEYNYRANGLLANKTANGVSESFVWASAFEVPLLLSDEEYDYVYGDSLHPLAQISKITGEVEYLHADQLGSVIAKTSSIGGLTDSTSFTPYGEGRTVSAFGFAGGWTDSSTGLIYFRARWYDPSIGVFLSVDPLLEKTQDAYGYGANSPLEFVDPMGLMIVLGPKEHQEIRDTVSHWWNTSSTGDKLDLAATVASAVMLTGLAFSPPGLVVAGFGLLATGLSAGAAIAHREDGETFKASVSIAGALPGITGVGLRSAAFAAKVTPNSVIGRLGNPNIKNFAPFRRPIRDFAVVRNPARNFTRILNDIYFIENYVATGIGPLATITCVASKQTR